MPEPAHIAKEVNDKFALWLEEGEGMIEGEKVQGWPAALQDIVTFTLSRGDCESLSPDKGSSVSSKESEQGELKPCPFCGGKAAQNRVKHDPFVACGNEHCCIGFQWMRAERWNTQVGGQGQAEAEKPETEKCPVCYGEGLVTAFGGGLTQCLKCKGTGRVRSATPRAQGLPACSDERQPRTCLWLIWSNEHHAWWGANERGYVKTKGNAGQYSFDKAISICRSANRGLEVPNETMLPVLSPRTDSGSRKEDSANAQNVRPQDQATELDRLA